MASPHAWGSGTRPPTVAEETPSRVPTGTITMAGPALGNGVGGSNMEVDTFPAGSRERLGEDLRQVVLAANADGIDLLRRGQQTMAFESLKYAEAVLVSNPAAAHSSLLALTCSNLGCYYRKAGLPRAALRYMERALRAEDAAKDSGSSEVNMFCRPGSAPASLATTKLNTCAALSSVGRHEEAEKLAVEATLLLAPQDASATLTSEECSLLAVACHNLGAEREHLGCWASAAVAYRQGSEIARKVLGPRNPLTRALTEECGKALSKAERHPLAPPRPRPFVRSGGSLPARRRGARPGQRPKQKAALVCVTDLTGVNHGNVNAPGLATVPQRSAMLEDPVTLDELEFSYLRTGRNGSASISAVVPATTPPCDEDSSTANHNGFDDRAERLLPSLHPAHTVPLTSLAGAKGTSPRATLASAATTAWTGTPPGSAGAGSSVGPGGGSPLHTVGTPRRWSTASSTEKGSRGCNRSTSRTDSQQLGRVLLDEGVERLSAFAGGTTGNESTSALPISASPLRGRSASTMCYRLGQQSSQHNALG